MGDTPCTGRYAAAEEQPVLLPPSFFTQGQGSAVSSDASRAPASGGQKQGTVRVNTNVDLQRRQPLGGLSVNRLQPNSSASVAKTGGGTGAAKPLRFLFGNIPKVGQGPHNSSQSIASAPQTPAPQTIIRPDQQLQVTAPQKVPPPVVQQNLRVQTGQTQAGRPQVDKNQNNGRPTGGRHALSQDIQPAPSLQSRQDPCVSGTDQSNIVPQLVPQFQANSLPGIDDVLSLLGVPNICQDGDPIPPGARQIDVNNGRFKYYRHIPAANKAPELLPGFEKADSKNLPDVDMVMFSYYMSTDGRNWSPELKFFKTCRNMRKDYCENAVGFVQVFISEERRWTLFARVNAEDIRNKDPNIVELRVNFDEITFLKCYGCISQNGLCKHMLAFASWLHYRSMEPSCTETKCYWTKSVMSTLSQQRIPAECFNKDQKPPNLQSRYNGDGTFLEEVKDKLRENNYDCMLMRQVTDIAHHALSIHKICFEFARLDTRLQKEWEFFLSFASLQYSKESLASAEWLTRLQSESPHWFALRYGRITASKLCEIANVEAEESRKRLIMAVFGSMEVKLKQTTAMKRGLDLEKPLRKQVSHDLRMKIHEGSLKLHPDHPHMAASPDGVSSNAVFEFKCPSKQKTFKNYVKSDGRPTKKVLLQLLMQMLFCGKKIGYLAVASENYEQDKNYTLIKVHLDDDSNDPLVRQESIENRAKLEEAMTQATNFWAKYIFPKLMVKMRSVWVH